MGVDKHSINELEDMAMDERAVAAGAHAPIDEVAEKRLLRKVDLHVVPMLTVLFLMAFLDRTNIGRLPLSIWLTLANMKNGRKCQDTGHGERSQDEGQ